MKPVERQKTYNNVVGMDGSPVRIKTTSKVAYSHDPLNDAILGELLGQTTKPINEPVYQRNQEIVKTRENVDYLIRINADRVKRVCLAIVTFVMVCGFLKVTVPFVTRKLEKSSSRPQAVRLATPAPVMPLSPLSPTQAATDKRMRRLEQQVGKIETVLTRVADDVQPPARPVHPVARRKAVIREARQVERHKHPAINRHQAARPVEKKQAEPVIINNDAPQTEELF